MELLIRLLKQGSVQQTGPVDEEGWERVLGAAAWHGVSGLLVKRLRESGAWCAVPVSIQATMEQSVREQSFRALAQVAGLAQVSKTLEDAGVMAVAWKGPAVSQELYGSYAVRSSSDLDFLLRRQDMPAAVASLAAIGFTPVQAFKTGAAASRAAHLNCELQLVRMRDKVYVELHDEVMPRLFGKGISIEECLGTARSLALMGTHGGAVRVLHSQLLLISLCAHGAKHGWERLKWLCDISAYLAMYGGETDWPALWLAAKRASALEAVLCGVRLAGNLLQAPLPESIRRYSPHGKRVDALVEQVSLRLLSGMMQKQTVSSGLRDALDTIGSKSGRLRYMVSRALTVNAVDLERFQLPEKLSALYQPLRIVRLLGSARRAGPWRS
jgi:hypothetical protein